MDNMNTEQKEYIIGEYTFETFHEYRNAQEDVKKIDIINRELDIHDPEVAIRLYNKIRDGEITFKSPIGEQFVEHVSDILADRSVDLLEDREVIKKAGSVAKKQRRIGGVIVMLAIVAFGYLGVTQFQEYMTTIRLSNLQERMEESVAAQRELAAKQAEKQAEEEAERKRRAEAAGETYVAAKEETPDWDKEKKDPASLSILPEFEELLKDNGEMVGWLFVDDTEINYPIVQRDNEYYLTRDFYGRKDENGTLFMDYRDDIVNPTTNTIIYGHNMKSGLMFGDLKEYLDEDYMKSHLTIRFTTLYEYRVYEVQAVCLTQVENQEDTGLRYYNFIQADNETQWDAFYNTISSLSVFPGHIDMKYGDQVLTLSTCNDYIEDGRLFIVAKRIQ